MGFRDRDREHCADVALLTVFETEGDGVNTHIKLCLYTYFISSVVINSYNFACYFWRNCYWREQYSLEL